MSTHSADTIFRQAVVAFKGKQLSEAQALLKQALRLEPTHADSWALMALILDHPAHKRDAVQRALKSNPHHPQARQILRAMDEAARHRLPPQVPPEASRPSQPRYETPPERSPNPPNPSILPPPPLLPWEKVSQEALPPAQSTQSSPPPSVRPSPPPPVRPSSPPPEPIKEIPVPSSAKKDVTPKKAGGLLSELKEELSGTFPILIGAVLVFGAIFISMAVWRNWSWGEESSSGRMRVEKEVILEKPAWLNEAEELRWSNQFEEAQTALLEASKRPEDEALALAALGLLLSDQLGAGKEALLMAEKAVEVAQEPAHQAYAAYALVRALEADTYPPNGAAIREAANKARNVASRNTYSQMAHARAEAANADWRSAMIAARDAVYTANEQEMPEAWMAVARATWQQADFLVSEEAFKLALAERQYIPWQLEYARFLIERHNFNEAEALLTKTASSAPNFANVAYLEAQLGLAKRDEGMIRAAIEKLSADNAPYADFLQGALATQQGNWTEAIDAYRRAATEKKIELMARAAIADAYSASKKCQEALDEADALEKIASVAPETALALSNAYMCWGATDKAHAPLRRVLQRYPYHSKLYHAAGQVASRDGQTEQAIDYFVDAIRYAPVLTGIHPSISDLYLHSPDPLGGLRSRFHAEIALELDPENAASHASMGRLLVAMRRYEAALEFFEQAFAYGDTTIESKYDFIDMLLLTGQSTRAVATLLEMDNNEEKSPRHLYALARGYRDLGNYDEARNTLDELQKMLGSQINYGIARFADGLLDPTGYLIPRDKIEEGLQLILTELLQITDATAAISTMDGHDWLTIRLPIDEALSPQEQIGTASGLIIVVGTFFARIDPAIDGGIEAQLVDSAGNLRLRAQVPADIAREYNDGLKGEGYLLGSMHFIRDSSNDPQMDAERALRIGLDMAEHRHLPIKKDVPFNIIPREELAKRFATDGSDARTQAAMRSTESLYKLLGLIGTNDSLFEIQQNASAANVLGFYEPDEAAFYLVTDNEHNNAVQDEITVAHEYQHALQDQYWGLNRFREAQDSDHQRAFQALAEGEATYSSFSYAYGSIPLFDLWAAFSHAAQVDQERLEASPRHVRSTILFPYEIGYAFVAAMVQGKEGQTDWEKVDALFDKPPVSTEQILHPEKYKKNEKPKEVKLPDLSPLGEGWTIQEEDVLGELSLNLLIEPFTGYAIASRAADGWGGDRYALLSGAEGQSALVLRIIWDKSEEADEFWGLWPLNMRHRPTFKRIIDDPLAAVYAHTRWWQGPNQTIFLHRENSNTLTLAIGPNQETLQPLADSLPGADQQEE